MEIERYWGMMENEHNTVGSNSYKNVKTFKYLGSLLAIQNFYSQGNEIRLRGGNSNYYLSIQFCFLDFFLGTG